MLQQRLVIPLSMIPAISAAVLLLLFAALPGTTVRAQAGATVSSQDIVKMVAAGLTEQVIINAIRQAPKRDFDLTPTGLIDLKKRNVSDAIIAEMQKASAPGVGVAPVPARVPSPSPSLTREQAVEIIGRSQLFTAVDTAVVKQALNCSPGPTERFGAAPGESDADFFRRMQAEILNPSIPQARETQGSALEALRSAGLVRTQRSAGCGVDRQRGPLQGIMTVLTADGISASKQWRQIDPNTWEVPIARRAVVAVTGIRGDAQEAAAEFLWRWVSPQRGISAGTRILTSEALFQKFDDGWRLNTSRLRDYFYDGFGKIIVPPTYTGVPSANATPATSNGKPAEASAPTKTTSAAGEPLSGPIGIVNTKEKGCFYVGSTVEDVAAVQGPADGMDSERKAMFYGTSRVYIADGRVTRWALGTPALKVCSTGDK